MEKKHENTVWVPHAETLPEPAGPGVTRRVLAYDLFALFFGRHWQLKHHIKTTHEGRV